MTTFSQFTNRCKMRHDFGDQIQVRYLHAGGEYYDTWVSGTEALQRLDSIETEAQLRTLSHLKPADLKLVLDMLPEATRNVVRRKLRDKLADGLEAAIGGNPIGDALSDAARGRTPATEPTTTDKDRWQALMRYKPFRLKVLELAWIALEGSFTDDEPEDEPDDWI
jgi:hypothetical protein